MKASTHRPTVAKIDLEAIRFNLQQVKSKLKPTTHVFAVVKANAYGHGAKVVSSALASEVDGFCVSNIDEALELRQAGISNHILILGVVPVSAIPLAIENEIALAVTSLEWLQVAKVAGIVLTGLKVHIKIDTGMGRLGFSNSDDVLEAVAQLATAGAIFEGIFTHFACADEVDEEHFRGQLERFSAVLATLPSLPRYVHASNSATSIWHADTVFNAVRLGDVLYGLNPSGHTLEMPYAIQPALQLTSELVQVKAMQPQSTIGYGATYKTTEREIIGVVPIGYADGLQRKLQGLSVLVDGQPCEIVGRVSMDQITVRLPKVYPIGTRATLIGQDGPHEVTVQDWADKIGTINYEVACLLSDRIPRIY